MIEKRTGGKNHDTVILSLGIETLASENDEKIWALAEEMGLCAEELFRKPDRLSGGQKRRISLLRALLFEGEVFLLDEPSKGLDRDTKRKVLKIIRRETFGKPLLIITHDKEVAESFGAPVVRRLSRGRLLK